MVCPKCAFPEAIRSTTNPTTEDERFRAKQAGATMHFSCFCPSCNVTTSLGQQVPS